MRHGVNNPVMISYNGEALKVSPRGRVSNVDSNKLGALPRGVYFIKN